MSSSIKLEASKHCAFPLFDDREKKIQESKFAKEVEKLGIEECKLLELLKANEGFGRCLNDGDEVQKIDIQRLEEGKGFLSHIHKISTHLSSGKSFEFIMKVPKPHAYQEFIGKLTKDMDCTNIPADQWVVDGHNNECEFYQMVRGMKGCPIPEIYVAEKYTDKESRGLLLMENLSSRYETLGFHRWATIEQSLSIARCVAVLQHETNKDELIQWSSKQRTSYFKAFYNIHMPDSIEVIKQMPGITPIAAKLLPILSERFGNYALFEKPKEYGALALCHGDLQPNNLMYERMSDGQLGGRLGAIIDWQITFYGNASLDLARFIVLCPGKENRKEAESVVYGAYYSEMQRLYEKDGMRPGFSYEQGFELYELALCQQIGFYLMFLGIYRARNPNKTGPLCQSFDQLWSNAVFASTRAIEIFEKRELFDVFG